MARSSDPPSRPSRDRLTPQSLEAEQATVGSLLVDRDAVARVAEVLRPEDFYREAHRLIYEVALHLFDQSQEVDLITVTEELRRRDQLEKVGGPAYLTALIDAVPAAANVVRYAEIVEEKALLRRLITAGDQIAGWAFEDSEPVDAIVDKAEQLIFSVAERRSIQDFIPLKPLLSEAFERINALYHQKEAAVGLSTGYPDLDHILSGMNASDLLILAARPSMGKTALALNIARNVAVDEGVGVGIFSLEMSKESLIQRLICSEARVDASDLRRGYLRDDDWAQIANAVQTLYDVPLYVDDTPAISTFDLRAKARRLMADRGIGLLIIDYLQLVRPSQRAENRQVEVSMIAQSLKSLARELQVPVIACSQLSRGVEQRPDKRPLLSDLRESGAIEQDADVVMFIYRESRYKNEMPEDEEMDEQPVVIAEEGDEAEIIVAKQRNGPTGTVKLLFYGAHTRFYSMDTTRTEPDY